MVFYYIKINTNFILLTKSTNHLHHFNCRVSFIYLKIMSITKKNISLTYINIVVVSIYEYIGFEIFLFWL